MRLSSFIIILLLGVVPVYSQVGIGTEFPDLSAALDVFASDKGVLLPRVFLQSSTDQTTISGNLVNGLLVFNTSDQNDLQAGFYYWYGSNWQRLGSENDSFLETITSLIDNENGTYTYINEIGDLTLIDIPSAVIEDLQSEGVIFNELITLFNPAETLTFLHLQADGTTLEYIDELENVHLIDLLQIIRDNENTTSLEDGMHTTITESTNGMHTTYQVHVPVARGADSLGVASYGVVKEASLEPQIVINNQGELELDFENIHKVISVTSDYTIVYSDALILGHPQTSDININLPDPTTHKGKKYTIKKENNDEDYYVNVIGNIAGSANQELYTAAPHSGWTFVSDGVQWRVEQRF